MDLNTLFQALTGMGYNEMVDQGGQQFPELPQGSRHHRVGGEVLARALRERFAGVPGGDLLAFLGSQAGGLGIEPIESLMKIGPGLDANMGELRSGDTMNDLRANFLGGLRGMEPVGGTEGENMEDFFRTLFGMNLQQFSPGMAQSVPRPPPSRAMPGVPDWSTSAIDVLAQGGQPNVRQMPQPQDPIISFLQSFFR